MRLDEPLLGVGGGSTVGGGTLIGGTTLGGGTIYEVKTCSTPKSPLFLHVLSLECSTKLCINCLNQFSVYFHI